MNVFTKTEILQFVKENADIFDAAEVMNPFSGSAWTVHFLRQVAQESWRFFVPEHVGESASFMLTYSESGRSYRREAVNNYYSSLFSPLISASKSGAGREDAMNALVSQLVASRPRCSIVNFSPLSLESQDTENLQRALSTAGWYTKQYDCFGNWYLAAEGLSFEQYMKGRESRLYNTWARKRKKFLGDPSAGTGLEMVLGGEGVERAMDAYDTVYAKSWKKPEPYKDFVRGWARVCAQKGWLRLGVAWMNGVPVAAQFWFTLGKKAYIFKLAYDDEYAKLSAGTVLSAYMFEHAIEKDRVVEIDYLSGDDGYKQSWMSARRQRVGVIAANPRTFRGLVTTATEYLGELKGRMRAPSR